MQIEFNVLYVLPYWQLYLLSVLYFAVLYFGLGYVFNSVCKWLFIRGWLNKIEDVVPAKTQIRYEIKNSVASILIFGLSTLPLIYFIRNDYVNIAIDTFGSVLSGVLILTIWNEIHFFIVHRIMHLTFFMKKVHYIHHASKHPTVYSVYSFHWFEALLLSTVPLAVLWLGNIAALSFALFPIVSLLLNFSGHCNYRFGHQKNSDWGNFATRHNQHHTKGKRNFGFATLILDKIYKKIVKHD